MPYIKTEPMKIEGTDLGYAIYPYNFSFLDHEQQSVDSCQFMILQLKESEFIETEKILHSEKIDDDRLNKRVVEKRIKGFVMQNPEHLLDVDKFDNYFKDYSIESLTNCK